ncbi:MAG: hypothetical protein AB7I98_01690 [Verrucomicrobiales bacterium]|nr:hypothetical protein [Verrucomicrobiae bacterium]MCP5553892.1 hypothetical protein [Akkermansiaceae bacterium]
MKAPISMTMALCLLGAGFPVGAQQPAPGVPVRPAAPGAATGKPGAAAVPVPPPPAIEYVGNSPEDIGVMPEQKRPLQVKDTETNPFANRTAEVDEVVVVEDTSEEQSIRKVLQNIRVGGVSRGDGGLRILVGNIILEKGLILPQLVEDQRERLIVSDISENEVEIAWTEKDSDAPSAKRVRLQVDVRPKVRQVLHGQVDLKKGEKLRFGIVDPLADRQPEESPGPQAPINQVGQ